MEARLMIMNGPTENMSISLHGDDAFILGRHPKCSLHFMDESVSSYHCRIFAMGRHYYIEDLGSTNGTYLNEQKVGTPQKLQSNDIIKLGNAKLCFIQTSPEVQDTTASPMSATMMGTVMFTSAEDENKIGDYFVLQKIGSGSTGEILKCRHIVSGQIVALKLFHAHCLDDVSLQRFLREVNTCMRFDHQYLIKVFEFGMYRDRPVLAMEYYDGISLKEYISQHGPMPVEKALKIASQITQGLRYAHKMGVVHRDLNPANILIAKNDEIKIIDFGIAKVYGKSITLTCQTLGTIHYIPPEQIDDAKSVDHRADIYALGATLYHLIYGKPPLFDVHGLNAMILRITEGSVTPLHKLMAIPKPVSLLVEKAMAPKRENRFQTAFEFFQAIIAELKV